jgi:hypothetical protein
MKMRHYVAGGTNRLAPFHSTPRRRSEERVPSVIYPRRGVVKLIVGYQLYRRSTLSPPGGE